MIETIEDLSEAVSGQSILSAEINEDGLHFNLSSGRVLIIAGYIAVSLYLPKESIQ